MWSLEESPTGAMAMSTPNNERSVTATELYEELKALADIHGYKWFIKNPQSLGMQITALETALADHFDIKKPRKTNKRGWQFTRKEEIETGDD